MIWRNPLALWGLLALGLPVAVHLLARRRARVFRLPTLRFLPAVPPSATRALELDDRVLLLIRLGVVAAAALALAGPLFMSEAREARLSGPGLRVFLVDTLSSDPPARAPALAREQDEGARSGRTLEVIETANLVQGVAGVSAWVATHPGIREIVVVSAFPVGSLDPLRPDLLGVPEGVGLRFVRVPPKADPPPAFNEGHWFGARRGIVGGALEGFRTEARWEFAPSAVEPGAQLVDIANGTSLVSLLPPPVIEAAGRLGARTLPLGRTVLVVPPGTPLPQGPEAPLTSSPWMADMVLGVSRDPLVADALRGGGVGWTPHPWGADTLALVLGAPSGSDLAPTPAAWGPLAVALLVASGSSGVLGSTPQWVGEPELITDDVLAGWAREAREASATRSRPGSEIGSEIESEVGSGPGSARGSTRGNPSPRAFGSDPLQGPSDARWLWALALVLIGVEGVVRRRIARDRTPEDEASA